MNPNWRIFIAFETVIATLGMLEGSVWAQNSMPPLAPSIVRQSSSGDSAPTFAPAPAPSSVSSEANSRAMQEVPGSKLFDDRPQTFVAPHQLNAEQSTIQDLNPLNSGAYMVNIDAGRVGARNVPAQIFRNWLEKAHPRFALSTSQFSPGDVVEVGGHWDDAGKSLRKLGIASTHISSGELRHYQLGHAKVLIINCAGFVNRDCFQRIRDFVSHGGYLMTTDWGVDNILESAFPGFVEYNHKRNRNLEYVAQVTDPDPVLFQNTVASANWKCENGCHLVTVLKPQSVRVIVRSHQLAAEDGEGILALTFPFGRGEVLHLVGHFDNNQGMFRQSDTLPDPAPLIGIALRQAIAGNFVVAGLTGVSIPTHDRRRNR